MELLHELLKWNGNSTPITCTSIIYVLHSIYCMDLMLGKKHVMKKYRGYHKED